MKQNDAVFKAVCKVLGQDKFDGAVALDKDQKVKVVEMVTQGIIDGVVDFSAEAYAKHDTPAKVKSYTTGMVNNHLRKDKRLNGGAKYEIKNPGSRAGQGDEQLKAMRALRTQLTKPEDISQLDEAINARAEAIKAESKKAVEINIEALPEAFRHLVK